MTTNTIQVKAKDYSRSDAYTFSVEAFLTGKTQGNKREVKAIFEVYAINPGGYSSFYMPYAYLYVNAEQKCATQVTDIWPRESWHTMCSWSGYIEAGQTITVKGRYNSNTDNYGFLPSSGNRDVSLSLELPALKSELGQIPDFIFDEEDENGGYVPFCVPVVTYGESFYNVLEISKGDVLLITREGYSGENISITPSEMENIYSCMLTENFATWKFVLKTYDCEDKIALLGISEKESVATISPTNRNPFLPDENFSAKDVNDKTLALTMDDQKYIKDQSTLQISIDTEAIANKGALIKSYVFRINGKDYFHTAPIGDTAYPLKEVIDAMNATSYTIIVTDTRNNTYTLEKPLELIDYTKPVITKFSVDRAAPDYTGKAYKLTLEGTFCILSNVANQNEISSLVYKYETSSGVYSDDIIVNNCPTDVNKFSYTYISKDLFEIDKIVKFELAISDKLSTTSASAVLKSAQPAIDIDTEKRIVSIGKTISGTTNGSLELYSPLAPEYGGTGQTSLRNLFSIIYPVGSVYISTNSTSPDTLFGGTWAQITDVFLLSAGSNYSAGSTGGEATHTLTVNEMPKHSHSIQYSETDGHYSGSKTEARPWGGDSSTTVGSSGGGASHNNMPPYLTVYMWKRTA